MNYILHHMDFQCFKRMEPPWFVHIILCASAHGCFMAFQICSEFNRSGIPNYQNLYSSNFFLNGIIKYLFCGCQLFMSYRFRGLKP